MFQPGKLHDRLTHNHFLGYLNTQNIVRLPSHTWGELMWKIVIQCSNFIKWERHLMQQQYVIVYKL